MNLRADVLLEEKMKPRRRRVWLRVLAAAAVLMVGAVSTFFVLRDDGRATGFADDQDNPVTGGPGVRWVDERAGYSIAVEEGWTADGVAGQTTILRPGSGTEDLEDDVSLTVVNLGPRTAEPDSAGSADFSMWFEFTWPELQRFEAEAQEVRRDDEATVAGRRTTRFDLTYPLLSTTSSRPPDARETVIWIDWVDGRVLKVDVYAETSSLHARFAEGIERMIASIAPLDHVDEQPVGTLWGPVGFDSSADELIRFLDARIQGAGAEKWVRSEASGVGRWLYAAQPGPVVGDAERDMVSYTVKERHDDDGGGSVFVVEIVAGAFPDLVVVTESLLWVAADESGSSAWMLRDVSERSVREMPIASEPHGDTICPRDECDDDQMSS